jgi:hypothetical protein
MRVLRAIVTVIARPDLRARRISLPLGGEEGERGAVGALIAGRSSRRPARVVGLGDGFVEACLEALFRAFGDGSGFRVGCFGFGMSEAYEANETNASPA